MLIVSVGRSIGAAVETAHLVQASKNSRSSTRVRCMPSRRFTTLLKAQNGLRWLQKVSLVLQELTCASKAWKSVHKTLSETDRSPPLSHRSVSFISASLFVCGVYFQVKRPYILCRRVQIDNTCSATVQTRQESLQSGHKAMTRYLKMNIKHPSRDVIHE